jgi:integrase
MSTKNNSKTQAPSKYAPFFMKSQRVSSKVGKAAVIIEPTKWNEFFAMLKADVESGVLDYEFAAALAVSISIGARVSEMLSIKVRQIDLTNGNVEDIIVLKKRSPETRMARLHPTALEIVREFIKLAKRRPHEFLVRSYDRHQMLYRVKKLMPTTDNHAIARHSKFSFFVEKKVDGVKIAKRMGLSDVNLAYKYVHLNTKRDLETEYDDVA